MPETTHLHIDPSLLSHYIETLGAIGQQAGGGIIRPVYGQAWQEARGQLADWMNEAGLAVREDAVGNLFGRLQGRADHAGTTPMDLRRDALQGAARLCWQPLYTGWRTGLRISVNDPVSPRCRVRA